VTPRDADILIAIQRYVEDARPASERDARLAWLDGYVTCMKLTRESRERLARSEFEEQCA
jgi:hypothetical protein